MNHFVVEVEYYSASRAGHERFMNRNREARKRALCGAGSQSSKPNRPKPAKQKLGRPPVEHIGNLTRVVAAIHMLRGRNKLDVRQSMAAETYRDAFETVHRSLGNVMDFSGVGGSHVGVRHQEAVALAAERLKTARNLVGSSGIAIMEHIICGGHSLTDCARMVFGGDEAEKPSDRDVNYAGRRLREALSELADEWHPRARQPRMQGYRPAEGEMVAGDAGIRDVASKPYVMR